MFKYWRNRTGPLRFSAGEESEEEEETGRKGKKKGESKAKPGAPFIHAGAIKPGGEVGSSTSSIFFPH